MFEASGTLERAYETVRNAAEQWNRGKVFAEIAEARAALLRAMKEAEPGWQRAIDLINERAYLAKGPGKIRRGALASGRPLNTCAHAERSIGAVNHALRP